MAANHIAPPAAPRDVGDSEGEAPGGRSILAHLDLFRRRLVYSCIAVAVGMLPAFAFINRIVDFVFRPMRSVLSADSKLIYTQPSEAFSVYLQIAMIAGIVFASPFIMYQVWRLIAPALFAGVKRLAVPFIVLTTVGFVAGAAFNHYVVFTLMIAFFAQFSSPELGFWPRLDDVFGLYTKMLFVMGLVFQMPTLVYFLAKMELVTARWLARRFKYAVFVIFIIAAVLTPSPDPVNQAVFAVPMIALYLLGILIAWVVQPAAARNGERKVE